MYVKLVCNSLLLVNLSLPLAKALLLPLTNTEAMCLASINYYTNQGSFVCVYELNKPYMSYMYDVSPATAKAQSNSVLLNGRKCVSWRHAQNTSYSVTNTWWATGPLIFHCTRHSIYFKVIVSWVALLTALSSSFPWLNGISVHGPDSLSVTWDHVETPSLSAS